jgi:hypothetical protein
MIAATVLDILAVNLPIFACHFASRSLFSAAQRVRRE